MGKKRYRSGYTSKGQRSNVSKSTLQLVSRGRDGIEKAMNKLEAWRRGQDPWITVTGPSSNMRFVRVRASSIWGDPKKARGIYTREEEVN